MSGNYFGFSHTASPFSQQQQGSYGQHGASAHQGSHVFSPSAAASPHTSYVVASTARPSAAAAYETTYTAQPASQYYSATPQRQDTHHQQAGSSTSYRAAAAYTTYTETTPTYEKQTYYPQQQPSNQSTTYYSTGGGGATARGKTSYTAYYQGGNQAKAKQTTNYQSAASSFSNQGAAKHAQPKQASVASVTYTPQSHASGGSYHAAASYGGNKKYNNPLPQTQQQHYNSGGGGGSSSGGGGGGGAGGYSYDAVVFSAASNYYQQQQRPQIQGMGGIKAKINGQGQKVPMRPQKAPPKPSQLHYCEICKISCAGPLTYKEHLEGQKHKKKENALKDATPVTVKSSQPSFRCELCDVTCTGMDAYNAHIRGSKHGKVFKLHTRLGKPIPSTDPVKINPTSSQDKTDNKAASGAAAKKAVTKKPVTPKISFVAGSKYSTTSTGADEKDKGSDPAKQMETKKQDQGDAATLEVKDDDSSNIMPVGEDYVEEIKNDEGKLISFNCKLCECRFNDPHAKEMHMKGRRHRLQYKNKVDPSLKVEAKPTQKNRRQAEERMKRKMAKEEMRRRDEELRWRSEMRKYDEEMFWRHMEEERYYEGMRHHEVMFHEWMRRGGPQSGLPPPPRGPFMELPSKKQENEIDRHVLTKHNTIYPKENELQAVQNMVSIIERALKMVSDFLAETDKPKEEKETTEEASTKEEAGAKKEEDKSKSETKQGKESETKEQTFRVMKGVMRVGVLAKGLLLTNDLNMELIVLCGEKPTRTLLERVFDSLPKQLAEITDEKYELSLCVEEAAIILTHGEENLKMTMKVSLTSPVMRDPAADAGMVSEPRLTQFATSLWFSQPYMQVWSQEPRDIPYCPFVVQSFPDAGMVSKPRLKMPLYSLWSSRLLGTDLTPETPSLPSAHCVSVSSRCRNGLRSKTLPFLSP